MSDDRRGQSSAATDPLQIWRDWLDRAERQWNQTFNELMATDRVGKTQARMIESLLTLQAQMNQATERYFSTLNLPTRTDVLSLGQQIGQLEERVADLERTLTAVARHLDVGPEPTSPARPRPKRTRKAPKKSAAARTDETPKKAGKKDKKKAKSAARGKSEKKSGGGRAKGASKKK